jgi:hypothetical protein
MQIRIGATRHIGMSAALLAGASLIFVTGFGHIASVAADPPEEPNTAVAQVADAQAVDSGSVPAVLVTLEGATADATYAVSDCSVNADGSTACVSDAKLDAVKTDDNGDASATLLFSGASASDIVKIVNVANPNDSFTIDLMVTDPGI